MSYQTLENSLGFAKSLPVTENWSAAPDFLNTLSDYCLKNRPQTILECSSGTSTLVLSRCCQLNEYGHVYSLENGKSFVEKTQQQLASFSLAEYCDVIHANLEIHQINDEKFQWYDLNNIPDTEIDLLVIDGPPGFIQQHSRYPALPLLSNKLAKQCFIFLDDAARADEREIVNRWLSLYPEFQAEFIDNERGCSILRR